MGLDISAYSRLETVREEDIEFNEYLQPADRRIVSFFSNPDYPYHISGVEFGKYYMVKGDSYSFRAGSYGGYNDWRDWLAKIAGYENANDIWSQKPFCPFVELINFSDCDGTIGSIVAEKLAKDFNDYLEDAKKLKDLLPFGLERYYDWKKACEIAAKRGAISFH